jgi:hypothetical protein
MSSVQLHLGRARGFACQASLSARPSDTPGVLQQQGSGSMYGIGTLRLSLRVDPGAKTAADSPCLSVQGPRMCLRGPAALSGWCWGAMRARRPPPPEQRDRPLRSARMPLHRRSVCSRPQYNRATSPTALGHQCTMPACRRDTTCTAMRPLLFHNPAFQTDSYVLLVTRSPNCSQQPWRTVVNE